MLIIKLRNTEILSWSVQSIRVNSLPLLTLIQCYGTRRGLRGSINVHTKEWVKSGSRVFSSGKELSGADLKWNQGHHWSTLTSNSIGGLSENARENWPQTNAVPCIPRHLHDFLGVQSISVGHWWMISSPLLNGGAGLKLVKEKKRRPF